MPTPPEPLWQVMAHCKFCETLYPASQYRDSCWRHRLDPLCDWEEDTKPGVTPTYQLDGTYLKTLKGL